MRPFLQGWNSDPLALDAQRKANRIFFKPDDRSEPAARKAIIQAASVKGSCSKKTVGRLTAKFGLTPE
jgi:hypothetical protein